MDQWNVPHQKSLGLFIVEKLLNFIFIDFSYDLKANDPEIEDSLPNVCNAALNLLKLFGKYIRMTSTLHSISEQVIEAVIQLFDYFLFLVSFYWKN